MLCSGGYLFCCLVNRHYLKALGGILMQVAGMEPRPIASTIMEGVLRFLAGNY